LTCLWLTAATSILPESSSAQLKVAEFRELLSSPPIIEEFIAERRYDGPKPTDFYFGRWQSNAFLLSASSNLELIERGGGSTNLADVRGRFDDEAWAVFGANRPLKIGDLHSVSSSNELVMASDLALDSIGRFLNAGIEHMKPRQIVWRSDTEYAGTNDANTIIVSGVLKTNSTGGVVGASMVIAVRPGLGITGGASPIQHKWELEYEYDRTVSTKFPSTIKRFVIKPDRRFLRDEIRFHRVRLANVPLAKSLFSFEPFIFTNSWVFRGTNDGFVYIDSLGAQQTLKVGKPEDDGTRSVIFPFLFIGAMLVLPIFLFRLAKRN